MQDTFSYFKNVLVDTGDVFYIPSDNFDALLHCNTFVMDKATVAVNSLVVYAHGNTVYKSNVRYPEAARSLTLAAIHCAPNYRQQGQATELLTAVCNAADEAGVTLYLNAVPITYMNPQLDSTQLVEWFKEFGFEVNETCATLLARKPDGA